MNKFLSAFALLALALPASANTREVINPNEPMVLVPGIEFVGPSRISTVMFCAHEVGVDDYRDLQTDSEFEGMEECLKEMT